MSPTIPPEHFLSVSEVSARIGVPVSTIQNWRKGLGAIDFPAPDAMIGQQAGWSAATIQAWNERRTRSNKVHVNPELAAPLLTELGALAQRLIGLQSMDQLADEIRGTGVDLVVLAARLGAECRRTVAIDHATAAAIRGGTANIPSMPFDVASPPMCMYPYSRDAITQTVLGIRRVSAALDDVLHTPRTQAVYREIASLAEHLEQLLPTVDPAATEILDRAQARDPRSCPS